MGIRISAGFCLCGQAGDKAICFPATQDRRQLKAPQLQTWEVSLLASRHTARGSLPSWPRPFISLLCDIHPGCALTSAPDINPRSTQSPEPIKAHYQFPASKCSSLLRVAPGSGSSPLPREPSGQLLPLSGIQGTPPRGHREVTGNCRQRQSPSLNLLR